MATYRGCSATTWPPASIRQVVIRCSSVAVARAFRALSSALSKTCRSSAVEARLRVWYSPAAVTSSWSSSIIAAAQPGMVAPSAARYPRGIDFSCGFQSFFPSGTRSSTRRVPADSRSNSANNSSAIVGIGRSFLSSLDGEGEGDDLLVAPRAPLIPGGLVGPPCPGGHGLVRLAFGKRLEDLRRRRTAFRIEDHLEHRAA